jgi:ribosomal protein S24E
MEILDRKENSLLDRVEISFKLRHVGNATPSRDELLNMAKTMEPGASKECIIIKDVNTRFGQPLTTGVAHIYGKKTSMIVEPKYMLERHGIETESPSEETKVKAAPVAATEVAGGEE